MSRHWFALSFWCLGSIHGFPQHELTIHEQLAVSSLTTCAHKEGKRSFPGSQICIVNFFLIFYFPQQTDLLNYFLVFQTGTLTWAWGESGAGEQALSSTITLVCSEEKEDGQMLNQETWKILQTNELAWKMSQADKQSTPPLAVISSQSQAVWRLPLGGKKLHWPWFRHPHSL